MLAAIKAVEASLLRFARDERGAELVEWAVLTLLVVVAGAAILVELREEVTAAFFKILSRFLRF